MNILLIVGALIIVTCIFLNKVSSRLGIPVLLLFILRTSANEASSIALGLVSVRVCATFVTVTCPMLKY